MFGGIGSTWGDNFYMGTQNGSKHEIGHEKISIDTLELKLRPFEVSPYVCIGSHTLAMFAHKKNYGRAGYVDDPLPNIVYIAIWMPACIIWLYYASCSTVW